MEVARSNRVSLTKIAPVKRPVFFYARLCFLQFFIQSIQKIRDK